MTLSEYIIDYRRKHDLSGRQFAALVGISAQYEHNLEQGINNHGQPISPSLTTYSKIAKGTGLSDIELLSLLDDNVSVNPTEPDDPLYHITMIGRGMEKMTFEKKEKALNLLRVAFPEEFSD